MRRQQQRGTVQGMGSILSEQSLRECADTFTAVRAAGAGVAWRGHGLQGEEGGVSANPLLEELARSARVMQQA